MLNLVSYRARGLMDQLDTLLLQLYGATRECGGAEFLTYAMSLLQPVLGYDSARMTTVDMRGGAVLVRESLLFREPDDMVLDWSTIAASDLVMHDALAHLNQVVTFHASSRYAGCSPGHAIMRDYAHRYLHRNGAVQIMHDASTGCHIGVSLYRAIDSAHFTEAEGQVVQRLVPHLVEAIQLSRALHGAEAGQGRLAIVSFSGGLHYCSPAFEALLQLEWPEWRPPHLPRAMLAALACGAARRYQGRHVLFTATVVGERLLLRGCRQFRFEQLAPREREVARLFGRGQSYKEIARDLDLAPATVRNTVQRVYQKLAVGSKAQLANLMSADI
jgi:DNA-binding CsgD family transcriptional regulator